MNAPRLASFCAAAAALFGSAVAAADPVACNAINASPVVYVTGSSAAQPFLAALARVLFNDAQPVTIVYSSAGSCNGVSAVLNGDVLTGQAIYWDPSSGGVDGQVPCTLAANTIADIGVSDVFPGTCQPLPNGLPADVGDFFGPIQVMTFIAPRASAQRSISALGAYFVFGFGGDSEVPPWTDNAQIFRRSANSGTQNMIGKAIGVSAQKFKGQDALSSAGVISKVAGAVNPQAAIGIVAATDITPSLSLSVRVLAYKHSDQTCSYYPDSVEGAHDKQNVRDGHYAIWGPLHMLSKLEGGYARNLSARRVLNYVTGTATPPGGLDLIQVEAVNNLIPACAMHVQREAEIGPLSSFAPADACGCAFERYANGKALCKSCTQAAECPAETPACNFGYCEVR